MKVGFTPRQVTRLTGVPYSTLNLWANSGLICPSIEAGSGSGNERVYSFTDLIALKVAFALRKEGVSTRSLKNVIAFLRDREGMEQPLVEARLVVREGDVVAVKSDKELVSILSNPGQTYFSFVLDLSKTVGELTELAKQAEVFAVGIADQQSKEKILRKPPAKAASGEARRSSRLRNR